jgi:uncharacterized protein YeaO (DUF488 family)
MRQLALHARIKVIRTSPRGGIPMIQLKRAYDKQGKTDGARFLVERLWPRGVKKTSLPIVAWLKDAAPSTELRKWFSHDPARWLEFRRRYFAELRSRPDAWMPLVEAAGKGTVTLIYSSHDEEHNNAVALEEFLDKKMKARTTPQKTLVAARKS